MNKRTKKRLSLLLCLLIFAAMAIACGTTNDDKSYYTKVSFSSTIESTVDTDSNSESHESSGSGSSSEDSSNSTGNTSSSGQSSSEEKWYGPR